MGDIFRRRVRTLLLLSKRSRSQSSLRERSANEAIFRLSGAAAVRHKSMPSRRRERGEISLPLLGCQFQGGRVWMDIAREPFFQVCLLMMMSLLLLYCRKLAVRTCSTPQLHRVCIKGGGFWSSLFLSPLSLSLSKAPN